MTNKITEPRPIDVHWFLPTSGDGRSVTDFFPDPSQHFVSRPRPADFDYMRQIAQAADKLGFVGVLTPTGVTCEDAWLMCAAVAPFTEHLRYLVAFRPGFVLPTLAAQMAATLQRISNGRTLINIVTGGDSADQRSYGDYLDHDSRYDRTAEFIDVFRRCFSPERFDYNGAHYQVERGGLRTPVGRDGLPDAPPVYFGGASEAAEKVAASQVDVYLLWGEPPEWVAERIARMRAKAAELGRTLRFGIRMHVIARAEEGDAWAEAERLLSQMDKDQIATAQKGFNKMESVGQSRMVELHKGNSDMESLIVSPNLWAGMGLVRGGAGTALVGNYDQVAERISEYAALGLDTFILSGYPHLEEAYNVGEEILPRVRGVTAGIAPDVVSSSAAS
ncbi:MAG: LLM class flavin-dependent oxidoreductase [Chloroflexota bacterium]